MCLQASYWEQPIWLAFRNDVENLAHCLAQYAEYVCQIDKQMKLIHSQSQPICEVGENLYFMFFSSGFQPYVLYL